MTNYKKIDNVSQDAIPQFPVSRKNGYVEDSVDEWMKTHFIELSQMIEYQNSCVDEIERLEAELAAAQANATPEVVAEVTTEDSQSTEAELAELHARNNELQVELESLTAALEQSQAHVAQLEATPAPEVASYRNDAEQATAILVSANEVAEAAKARAIAEAKEIVENAEASLSDLKQDIIELNAKRIASFEALKKFHTDELEGLINLDLFQQVEEVEVTEEVVEAVSENAEDSADSDTDY